MDMSQYRALFLTEAREHLTQMNKLVVALEQNPGDNEALNALFREAHSLKGMAATMGFEQTAQLAHHLEDSLDHCRKSGHLPEMMADRLLEGIDLLEGLVDDIEADTPERDISAFLKDFGSPPAAASPEDLSDLPSEALLNAEGELLLIPIEEDEAEDVAEVVPETDLFQVRIALAADSEMPAARGLLLLRELEQRGEIVSAQPDKAALLAGEPFEQVSIWFRTSLQRDHVREVLLVFPDVAVVDFIEDRRQQKPEEVVRTVRVRTDLLDRFVNLAGELITQRHVLQSSARVRDWEALDEALERADRLVRDLHHHVLRTRLMPLETIAGRLPRIVRDLGRKTGKQVTFRLIGGEVGLDRVILDELADPLVHLVRNAVDHGVSGSGEVIVSARRERDLVLVEVRDDGVGMDPASLREKAVQKGLLNQAQAEELSDREALLLVCRPGFSTAEAVTETSGRGVGMDVVKAAVEKLGGNLEIESELQRGTCFRLKLPLSIAIVKLVLVRCAGMPLALPVTRVQHILELPQAQIAQQDGPPSFILDGAPVPIISLADLLGQPEGYSGPEACIVLTEWQGAPLGLQVDGFIGHRDAFVKTLGFPFDRMPGLSGATIEGDGSVLFVVDPQTLLAAQAVAP